MQEILENIYRTGQVKAVQEVRAKAKVFNGVGTLPFDTCHPSIPLKGLKMHEDTTPTEIL